MHHNRRNFLKLSGLTAMANSMPTLTKATTTTAPKAIVIATWDSGVAVAKQAYTQIKNNLTALDAVEAGAVYIENQINCCVGLGGNPDRDGIVTLDASIMDHQYNCGAVAGLEQIAHPIQVARKVMELTPHVMLVGNGALQFALQNGFEKMPQTLSTDAQKTYVEWLKKTEYKPQINIESGTKNNGPFAPIYFDDGTPNHDTMGLVALDNIGNLSGACTTSGMAFKLHGRVGDSPIIGAGLYVDGAVGAVTSSGLGEAVIKVCGSYLVTEYMRQGNTPQTACRKAIERIVQQNKTKALDMQVGFIALNKAGQYGAYALQKGFQYAVHSASEVKLVNAPYYFNKK